ncbi:MAG: sulfatase activating formylglycine-generating enzyme [Myxococcota bacterium]|jgi:formylglycine-generating enzyme required for sulfatase activity
MRCSVAIRSATALALALVLGCSSSDETTSETVDAAATSSEPVIPTELVTIEGGRYLMGSPAGEGFGEEQPQHIVTQPTFQLEKYEVTHEQYVAFLQAQGNECVVGTDSRPCMDCNDPDVLISCDDNYAIRDRCQAVSNGARDKTCANHPAVEVTWHGCHAYCAHIGRRLPSEAEWERAANGPGGPDGTDWRRYPWGSNCPGLFNFGPDLTSCEEEAWTAEESRMNCVQTECFDGFKATAPVDSFPAGVTPEGLYNMSGNVWEWVEDDWHTGFEAAPTDGSAWLGNAEDAFGHNGEPEPENGKGSHSDEDEWHSRVVKGGGWYDPGFFSRSAIRVNGHSDDDIGCRCAL